MLSALTVFDGVFLLFSIFVFYCSIFFCSHNLFYSHILFSILTIFLVSHSVQGLCGIDAHSEKASVCEHKRAADSWILSMVFFVGFVSFHSSHDLADDGTLQPVKSPLEGSCQTAHVRCWRCVGTWGAGPLSDDPIGSSVVRCPQSRLRRLKSCCCLQFVEDELRRTQPSLRWPYPRYAQSLRTNESSSTDFVGGKFEEILPLKGSL